VTGGIGSVVVLVIIDDYLTGDLEAVYVVHGPLGNFWWTRYPFFSWEAVPKNGFINVGELEIPIESLIENPHWETTTNPEVIHTDTADTLLLVALLHTKWQATDIKAKLFTTETKVKWRVGRLF